MGGWGRTGGLTGLHWHTLTARIHWSLLRSGVQQRRIRLGTGVLAVKGRVVEWGLIGGWSIVGTRITTEVRDISFKLCI